MAPTDRAQLLNLPPGERAELALLLWESLSDAERSATFPLDSQDQFELDRRWAEHLADPQSAIPWSEVLKKGRSGT
jgi:putative addiction module component (TIGR02574 family)